MATVTPCDPDDCASFGAGHRIHHIQARLMSEMPWGWRQAIVTGVDGCRVTIHYVVEDAEPMLWHHKALPLTIGEFVSLHERFGVLRAAGGNHSVVIEGGLGPVPTPE